MPLTQTPSNRPRKFIPLSSEDYDNLKIQISEGVRNFSHGELEDAEERHPLDTRNKLFSSYTATAEYLFKCTTCDERGMMNPWYQLIIDTIGGSPYFHRKTNVDEFGDGNTGKNLTKMLPGDEEICFTSSINHIPKRGYVCDHCNESIFEGEEVA